MIRKVRPGFAAVVLVLASAIACNDVSGPDPNEVAAVLIVAPTLDLAVNQSVQLEGRAATFAAVRVDHLVTWSSSDEATISVTQAGLVTGLKLGAATITATAGNAFDSVLLTVSSGKAGD